MLQAIIVVAILLGALLFTARYIVRLVRGKGGCNCGCSNCPMNGDAVRHCAEREEERRL